MRRDGWVMHVLVLVGAVVVTVVVARAVASLELFGTRTPDTPAAEVMANQCDRVRTFGSIIALGDDLVTAVDAGDRARAHADAARAMDLWYEVQMGVPYLTNKPDLSPAFHAQAARLGAALPRVEWFATVMNAPPLEDAARGTRSMLPEIRGLMDGIGLPACAVVALPSPS
jgi:hypothetical protein